MLIRSRAIFFCPCRKSRNSPLAVLPEFAGRLFVEKWGLAAGLLMFLTEKRVYPCIRLGRMPSEESLTGFEASLHSRTYCVCSL